jgi:hypothetical protein
MELYNDYLVQQQMLDRQREAERQHQVHAAQANRPNHRFYGPMLAGLGRQMNNLGQQLQKQYETPKNLVMES